MPSLRERSADKAARCRPASASHQVLVHHDRHHRPGLAERGLVVRDRDPRDRRALLVRLTGPGKDLMEQVNERKHAWSMRVLSALAPEERAVVIDVLERYLAVIQRELEAEAKP